MLPIVALIVWIGVAPNAFLARTRGLADAMSQRARPRARREDGTLELRARADPRVVRARRRRIPMTDQLIVASRMQELFSAQTLLATGALRRAVSVGILLLVLVEVVPGIGGLRKLDLRRLARRRGLVRVEDDRRRRAVGLRGAPTSRTSTTSWWTMLFLASTLIAWIFGQRYYDASEARFEGEHDILLLTAASGMVLMAGSRDLLVFFVGLELLSVPLYTLSGVPARATRVGRSGHEVLRAGRVRRGDVPVRRGAGVRGTGTLTLSSDAPGRRSRSPLALAGAALLAGEPVLQGERVPVPPVGARRVPGRADAGDDVHGDRHEGRRRSRSCCRRRRALLPAQRGRCSR